MHLRRSLGTFLDIMPMDSMRWKAKFPVNFAFLSRPEGMVCKVSILPNLLSSLRLCNVMRDPFHSYFVLWGREGSDQRTNGSFNVSEYGKISWCATQNLRACAALESLIVFENESGRMIAPRAISRKIPFSKLLRNETRSCACQPWPSRASNPHFKFTPNARKLTFLL